MDKITVSLANINGKLCKKSELKVDFDVEEYGRQKNSKNQNEIDEFMEQKWSDICKSNHRIYNASKFRLAAFQCNETDIEIKLGITSYKVCM